MKFFVNGLSRIVLFGVNDLTVAAAKRLTQLAIPVVVVSAQRMRNALALADDGSGLATCDDRIRALGIDIHEWDQVDVDQVRRWHKDDWAAFSFDSPFIIGQSLIDLFEGRIFNEHGAKLPQGRGGGGFTWRILDGDREGRVIFHQLVREVDAGAILHSREFKFDASCRKPIDYMRQQLVETSSDLAEFICKLVHNDDVTPQLQDERYATYFPRLSTKDQALVNWGWSADEIERFVLAFSDPYPGARTEINGAICVLRDGYTRPERFDHHPFKWGLIYNILDGRLFVCCRDGTFVVTDYGLASEGKSIKVGDRFHTPSVKQDDAWGRRAAYGPKGLAWKQ